MAAVSHHERAAVAATQPQREVLSFRLGAEEYGIDILRVQEIRSYERPTEIANAPAFIKGVVNLRGVIVPIVNLRLKFRLPDASYSGATSVVVLNVGNRVVGAVVDSVSDVIALGSRHVHAPLKFNQQIDVEHINGLATIRDASSERLIVLLNIDKLMQSLDMGLFDAPQE